MPIAIEEGYAPGCIGRIAQLHAEYYAAHHGFGVRFEAKVASDLAHFCMSYKPGRDALWLARDRAVQGSIAVDGSNANQSGAHLRWFIASDALRGKGVGRLLLGRALEFADARRYQTVHLSTFAGLDAARHLYEAYGFRLVHQSRGSTWGAVVEEQRFVRGAAP